MSHIAYIAIGSNMGSPADNCKRAAAHLDDHPALTVTARSSLYESEPFGKTDQDWFVNAAIQVETSLSPSELLEACQCIESVMGRAKVEQWGPRIIDLDILFYDDWVLNQEGLEIPHPGIQARSFVLMPMKEIAPDHIHPHLKKSIHTLAQEIESPQQIKRLDSNV